MNGLFELLLPMLGGLTVSIAIAQFALTAEQPDNKTAYQPLPIIGGRWPDTPGNKLLLALSPPTWRHPLPSMFLHTGTWLLLFIITLLLLQRPWFAMILVLAFQMLLLLVNHAKYDSLREPFIFQDFEYFTDAFKHPRLYLPFFGIGRTIAATIGFVSALLIGFILEVPLTAKLALPLFAIACFSIFLLGVILLGSGLKRCPTLSFDPIQDLQDLGQIAFFWAYWQAENRPRPKLDNFFSQPPTFTGHHKLPHIVAVQSESFFDPRPLSTTIKSSVLKHFDEIKSESCYSGRLQVPAWGANTVRSESAFLTGLTPEQLGIHRFNPYRLFAKQDAPNLVRHLKQAGYRTLCIHPYPASFYLRNKVFPRLGFDEFFDITHFTDAHKEGQFVGDFAIANMVDKLLQASQNDDTERERPLFIFVITMENHGPLHLEQPRPTDWQTFYQPPPPSWSDLAVYIRHLKNADLMIKKLKESLCSVAIEQKRDGIICWYGDHVPIMADVYRLLGEPDGVTDYFIWQTGSQKQIPACIGNILPADKLPELLIKAINDRH